LSVISASAVTTANKMIIISIVFIQLLDS
jgi:hypothetical protein